jgi:hypothetical protein
MLAGLLALLRPSNGLHHRDSAHAPNNPDTGCSLCTAPAYRRASTRHLAAGLTWRRAVNAFRGETLLSRTRT